jgi:hypothetical protein
MRKLAVLLLLATAATSAYPKSGHPIRGFKSTEHYMRLYRQRSARKDLMPGYFNPSTSGHIGLTQSQLNSEKSLLRSRALQSVPNPGFWK